MAKGLGTSSVQRLLGFWVCWHTLGGYAGLVEHGWPRPSLIRYRAEFQAATGKTVEEYRMFDAAWSALPHGRPEPAAQPAPEVWAEELAAVAKVYAGA